jgi:hypothetical protein
MSAPNCSVSNDERRFRPQWLANFQLPSAGQEMLLFISVPVGVVFGGIFQPLLGPLLHGPVHP